jgi:hypothetical protein
MPIFLSHQEFQLPTGYCRNPAQQIDEFTFSSYVLMSPVYEEDQEFQWLDYCLDQLTAENFMPALI